MNRRRVVFIFAAVGIPVILVGILLRTSLTEAPIPHYQQRVFMPGMGNEPVSLWVEPKPHRIGQAQLTTQVANASGSPQQVRGLSFQLISPGNEQTIELLAEFSTTGPLKDTLGNAPAYTATVEFDRAGIWQIVVIFDMGGRGGRAKFDVEVGL